jgi:hypothetical protein
MAEVVAAAEPRPYLRDRGPLWAILLTFPFITLPLVYVHASDMTPLSRALIYDIYLCVFGLTHFVLTFTVYLQSDNLEHYGESTHNQIIYFLAPLGIFLFFPIFFGTGLATSYPVVAGLVLLIVRFANYRHLTRQAYGVSRMLGRAHGAQLHRWQPIAEHAFLSALTLLMFFTFLYGGRFTWDRTPVKLITVLSIVLAGIVAFGYGSAAARSQKSGTVFAPATYMLLQTISILLAVWRTELYVATLAMHYVEYHVLMVPRCFQTKLNSEYAPDRLFANLRANRFVFYGGLITIAAFFMIARKTAEVNGGPMTLYMFDALFVFHYFIESYIWRFSVPHYRHALSPLYFARA